MKHAILNALNIRKGEESAILLLLLYSFIMGSVIAFFYTAATSLFVVSFDSSVLPYAYIGGGIMSYLVWLIYARVERVVSFQTLTLLGIFLLLVAVGSFVVGIHYSNNKWLTFLMFVWIRVFIFISVVGFWGLATKLFDLRQGKRIFGLISSGEVISDIIGFFSIPFFLKFIDTSDLLYISLGGLIICLFLMVYIFQRFQEPLSTLETAESPTIKTSFKVVFKDKYLTVLILMALLPMFGMCFADYTFLYQIKVEFKNQDLLASFLSIFFGATAVAEFILKSFFSGRLLNKYGLKVALPVLPAVLAGCVFLAIASGVLYGPTGLFFSFIAFTKMLDRVFRSAMYDPAYQILYQPLPPEERLNAQGMVEGMAKGLGFALAGAVVLIFSQFKALNLVYFNILFIIILIVWVMISLRMYKEYRRSLGKILSSNDKEISSVGDYSSNLTALSNILEDEKDVNVSLIMNIMVNVEPQKINRFLQQILVSSAMIHTDTILKQIRGRRLIAAEQILKNELLSNPNNACKELFEYTLTVLQQIPKGDYDTILKLSQSKDTRQRTLAANLLAFSGSYKINKILQALLQDEHPETRKAALYSAGQIGKRELWPYIIHNLFHTNFSTYAITAIKMIGEPILSELDILFDKHTTTKDVRLKIIAIFASIRCEKSLNFLRSRIHYPDEAIRNHIFKALSKLEFRAKLLDVSQIKEIIDEEISITNWVMAATLDIQKENGMPLLKEALQYELVQKKENVFLLLSMLYGFKPLLH
jgi:ATP/ADP translocase/HEAT repeat protein